MKYEFRGPNNQIRQCDDERCLPNVDVTEALYNAWHKLYVNGKRVSKAEAIDLAKNAERIK